MYVFYVGTDVFADFDLVEIYKIEDVLYENLFIKNGNEDYFFLDKNKEEDSVTIFNSELDIAIKTLGKIKEISSLKSVSVLEEIIKIFTETKERKSNIYVLYLNE